MGLGPLCPALAAQVFSERVLPFRDWLEQRPACLAPKLPGNLQCCVLSASGLVQSRWPVNCSGKLIKFRLQVMFMWLQKLSSGVLRVLTPLGPRYVRPSFTQRLYLLWLFRLFPTLPVKVLSLRQQRWMEQLCAIHGFVALEHEASDVPLLGTLEQRPPIEARPIPPRSAESVAEAVRPFAADAQHRS